MRDLCLQDRVGRHVDGVVYGFWVPKLRVVESGICRCPCLIVTSRICGMQVTDLLGGSFRRRVTDMWGRKFWILDAEVAGCGVADL